MRSARTREWTTVVALIALTVLFYAHSARLGFLYDDHRLIVLAEPARSVGDVLGIFAERHWYNLPYYRPVARLTMVLQKAWHGNEAGPFHLFNAAVMGGIAALVYGLLRLPALRAARGPAVLAALLVALHPIASSCVYPICSGRETAIPALLTLATCWAFLRGGRSGRALALGFYTLAVFSKEQVVVVPGLLLLADLLRLPPDPPGRSLSRWVRRHLPFVAVTAAYLLVRTAVFGGIVEGQGLAVLRRPMGPPQSLLYALQTIVLPFHELRYEARFPVWFTPGRAVVALLAFGLFVLGLVRADRELRNKLLWLAGLFVLTLLPTANFLHQEAKFAERFALLALVASALALGLGLGRLERGARLASALVLLAALVLARTSHQRSATFQDDVAFMTRWQASDPRNPQPHVSLGDHYAFEGDHATAMGHYRTALDMDPRNAIAHNNLGSALRRLAEPELAAGRWRDARPMLDESLEHYRQAVALDPDYVEALANLGAALLQDGLRTGHEATLETAIAALDRALALDPRRPNVASNAGAARMDLGQRRGDPALLRAAEANLRAAIEVEPQRPDAYHNLASLLARRGEVGEALDLLEHLAQRAERGGRRGEAVQALRAAVKLAREAGADSRHAGLRAELERVRARARD